MRRNRALMIGAVVVVVAVAGTVFALTRHSGAAGKTAAGSTLATVARGTVTVDVAAAGTVQAAQTRGLSFSLAGTVTTLNVKAGDTVTAGEVLATIDTSDATSAVNDAQTAVNTAEDNLVTAQTAASAAAAAAATPTATTPSTHSSGGSGGSSGGGNSGGGNGGGGNSGTQGQGQTQQVRSTGTDAIYNAQVQLNNAQLALTQAQRKLAGTTITAPIDGKVLTVTGAVGATENPGGTAFLTVGSISDTQIKAQFSEADVAKIAVGQSATITLPNQTGTLTGKVSSVDPAGTASGALVRYSVMVSFDTPPATLLYGQSANVKVTTQSAANVLYVSSSAVTGLDGSTGTVTVRTAGHDEARSVQIGLRGDQYTEVTSGLNEGDQVVISSGG